MEPRHERIAKIALPTGAPYGLALADGAKGVAGADQDDEFFGAGDAGVQEVALEHPGVGGQWRRVHRRMGSGRDSSAPVPRICPAPA